MPWVERKAGLRLCDLTTAKVSFQACIIDSQSDIRGIVKLRISSKKKRRDVVSSGQEDMRTGNLSSEGQGRRDEHAEGNLDKKA